MSSRRAFDGQEERGCAVSFLEEFAENLRDARRDKGWTQRTLAQQVGVSCSCITQYETAKRMPNLEITSIMSHLLGISLDDLIPYVKHDVLVDENQMTVFDMLEGEDDE